MARKKRQRKEPTPGWVWMLFGLTIGLAVALVVYLRSGGPELDFERQPTATLTESPAPVTEAPPPPPQATQASDQPGSGIDESDDELLFFEDLANESVAIPESESALRADSAASQRYEIQAGSFRTFQDADRRKADLAFLGIESTIVGADINGTQYQRVMIGPLSERGEINRVQRQLRNARIEYLLLEFDD